MATPDPHTEELRLMTYDERPRACKVLNRTPRRHEFIEVLWCLDQLPGLPDRWCTAEVLHIAGNPAQEILASGVIRYVPDETWNEEIHTVEFLKDQKLRRTSGEDTDQDDLNICENQNPVTSWQFSKAEKISSAQSDDDEWMDGQNDHFTKSRRKETPDTLHHTERTEMQSLRSGYSALVVELEKVKRELLTHSQAIRHLQSENRDGSARSNVGNVLRSLKHRLGLKMQVGLRTMGSVTGKRGSQSTESNLKARTGDGLHVDVLRVRVECTLNQFETIARQAKALLPHDTIFFSPDFSYTQLPSLSSSAFRVMFSTFNDMASFIGVTATSDLMEMTRKCGNGPHGDILRILGCYKYNPEDQSSAL